MNQEMKQQVLNDGKENIKMSRKIRVFIQVFSITLWLLFLSFVISYSRSENSPLWVLILYYSLPFLSHYQFIIAGQIVYNERGRRYLKESYETTNKENNETNHEEMNRSIKKVKKIRKYSLIIYSLSQAIWLLLGIITLQETTPFLVRLLTIVPALVIICYMPKILKTIEEERRKKFIEDTDEGFDKEQLMDEHKKILKDLR